MSDIFKLRVDVGTSHIELEGEGTPCSHNFFRAERTRTW